MNVYLSGPVTGCDFDEMTSWRGIARRILLETGIRPVSPLRGKEGWFQEDQAKGGELPYRPGHNPRQIVSRDHFDVLKADILLVNLLGAKRVSIGTVCEMAWAYDRHIPIIGVLEDGGTPHHHEFVLQMLTDRFDNLDDALQQVIEMAVPYVRKPSIFV